MINKSIQSIFIFVLFLICQNTWAAQITSVNGKKVSVALEGQNFKAGDILRVLSKNGKTVGLVKILNIKDNQAEGLLKGKAVKGLKVELKPKSENKPLRTAKENRKMSPRQDSTHRPSQSSGKNNFWGGFGGINSTTAEIKNQSSITVELKGTGMSAMGFFDYELLPSISLRGLLGLEQFNVDGPQTCGTAACEAKINYISGQAWGRYMFTDVGTRWWAGAGFAMLFPMSKSATALTESSITTTSVFSFGGGLDVEMSPTAIMPIQFEYNLYPSSDTVKASAMTVRVGYGVVY